MDEIAMMSRYPTAPSTRIRGAKLTELADAHDWIAGAGYRLETLSELSCEL